MEKRNANERRLLLDVCATDADGPCGRRMKGTGPEGGPDGWGSSDFGGADPSPGGVGPVIWMFWTCVCCVPRACVCFFGLAGYCSFWGCRGAELQSMELQPPMAGASCPFCSFTGH